MAVYAVGDIHGCLKALETIFDKVAPTKDDTVVFLGDYVDRGPRSKHVIQWILDRATDYKFVNLKGNHEIMMMRSRIDPIFLERWKGYGGTETLTSYGVLHQKDWSLVPETHWAFMEDALSLYTYDDYIFVHAGLEPGTPLHRQSDQSKFWDKYEHPLPYQINKTVICGHTARKNGLVADFGHTVCIDTYAYGGGWLTCLEVESGQYWQANQDGNIRKGMRNAQTKKQ